jgi:hypothetical protein
MASPEHVSHSRAKRHDTSAHKSSRQKSTPRHQQPAVRRSPVAQPPHGQQHRAVRRAWWQGPVPLIGSLVLVALIVGIFILQARLTTSNTTAPQPSSATTALVTRAATNVDPRVLNTVKAGGLANPLTPVAATPMLKDADGKPIVLYVGGEFCPYCAAERWSLVVALSRFGTFSDLKLTQSSSTDVYPDTATFSFVGSHYTSQYLTFQGVEIADRQQQPLQKLTAEQQAVMATYDAPPYTQVQGGVPFVSIGNQYVTASSGFNPQLLAGLSWEEIAARLSNPQDPATQGIIGNANYLTAAICEAADQQPASVCATAPIPEIQQQLPARP